MTLKSLSGARVWMRTHYAFHSKKDWYSFLKKLFDKISGHDLSERAASVAYNLILAVFPTIIFLFTLIPFINFIPNLEQRILRFFARLLPFGAFDAIATTIKDIVSRPRGGVLSFGFILALYSATNGMVALMNAFNSSNETYERRGYLAKRGIAVGLTVALAISLFLAIGLLVIGGVIIDYLLRFGVFNNTYTLLSAGHYPLPAGVWRLCRGSLNHLSVWARRRHEVGVRHPRLHHRFGADCAHYPGFFVLRIQLWFLQ